MLDSGLSLCIITLRATSEKTLARLFGWQHGSRRDICPTVVFRYAALAHGMPDVELPPVQLLAPSRDDIDVKSMQQPQSAGRVRVDGYTVPVRPVWSKPPGSIGSAGRHAGLAAVAALFAALTPPSLPHAPPPQTDTLKKLYLGMQVPAGRRLVFESNGWSGTQLVFSVSHQPADGDGAATAATQGAADSQNTAVEPSPVAQPAGSGTPLASVVADGSGGILQPLYDRRANCGSYAQRIIASGRTGWLSTEQVHALMLELKDWPVGPAPQRPQQPSGVRVFAERGARLG